MLSQSSHHQINFTAINCAAPARLPAILNRVLPRGQRKGREFVGLNPRRADHHLGSFRINLDTGRWAGFATGDKGGDLRCERLGNQLHDNLTAQDGAQGCTRATPDLRSHRAALDSANARGHQQAQVHKAGARAPEP
jgi:hypothetical protein